MASTDTDHEGPTTAPSTRPGREFARRFWGYRRKDVDAHLAEIDTLILELQESIEATAISTDQHDLVLRATRRSVEDTMERAQADADAIRATAERDAAQLISDAYELVQARGAAVIDLRAAGLDVGPASTPSDDDLFAPEPTES